MNSERETVVRWTLRRNGTERGRMNECCAENARLRKALDTERLAALIHDEWVAWSQSVAGEVGLERRARWESYWVPYADLPDDVQEYDRVWARKVNSEALEEERMSGRLTPGRLDEMRERDGSARPELLRGVSEARKQAEEDRRDLFVHIDAIEGENARLRAALEHIDEVAVVGKEASTYCNVCRQYTIHASWCPVLIACEALEDA